VRQLVVFQSRFRARSAMACASASCALALETGRTLSEGHKWSFLRPGVILLWYVSFSNFQLALVVSDKGGISAREFLSPMRRHITDTRTHLFRLARSS
jgi:hypothetical protein